MRYAVKYKQRSDGVVQRYWVKIDDDGGSSIVGNLDNASANDRVLQSLNPDDFEYLKQNPGKSGFVVGDEQTMLVLQNEAGDIDYGYIFPNEDIPKLLSGEDVPNGEAKVRLRIKKNSDGTEQCVTEWLEGDGAEWEEDFPIEGEAIVRLIDRVAEKSALDIADSEEQQGHSASPNGNYAQHDNHEEVDYQDEFDDFSDEEVVDSFTGDDAPTQAWSETVDAPTEEIDYDSAPDNWFTPLHSAYPHLFNNAEGSYYSKPGYEFYSDSYGLDNSGVNDQGYAMWEDGFDGADFIASCNKRKHSQGYINDFGIRKAPPGYPGEFIVEGVNITNPAQQRLVDSLCREKYARDMFMAAKKDPFVELDELDRLRQEYIDAKKDAKSVNSAVKGALRQKKFREFSEKHPVAGSVASNAVLASRLAKRTAGRFMAKRRERKRARTLRYQQERQRRLQKSKDPRRGIFGMLKRFIVSGIKFRFMDRIWGRR